MDTYKAKIMCGNCFYREEVEIPKGKKLQDWIAEHKECPNCGCSRFRPLASLFA